MSGGVGSPTSEGASSNPEKKEKKEKQHCKLCDVDIPPGPDSLRNHEAGKRHERMRAQVDAVEALARRSVFIKIAPTRAPSPVEMETEATESARSSKPEIRLRLQNEEIERVMTRFGKIERILCRAESGHYAIVEYGRDEDAKTALAARSVLMSCATVASDGTIGPIQMTTILISERRVNFSAAAPIEKHRINVDEIIDVLSRLIIDPTDDAYTVAIDEVIRYMVLSEDQLRDREALAARLEAEMRKYFAAPTVKIFGSSITSIGTIDSDIDMCLLLSSMTSTTGNREQARIQFMHEMNQRDKYTLLTGDAAQFRKKKVVAGEVRRLSGPDRVRFVSKMLNEVRKECGWMGVQRPVVDCRLPIVRFLLHRETLVDLSVDNAIGVAKSEYIRDLIKADSSDRLRRMLIGLRFWALSNGLFEAQKKEHKGHFNAYMLNLLAIAFLQSNGALPPFQHAETAIRGGPGGRWRIDFIVPPYSLEQVTIQAFLKSFFIHMTSGVSLRESVIVGRNGEQLSLLDFSSRDPSIIDRQLPPDAPAAAAEDAAPKFEFSLMNLQDPIELSHNVTSTLNEKYVRRMRHMMMRSLHAMKGEASFCSILAVEKRLARDADTPVSGGGAADESMGENGSPRAAPPTASSMDRPITAMVEPEKAEATVACCYPREQPASMAAMMRAAAFVFEKILLAEEMEDPTRPATANGESAAKRRRGEELTEETREKMEERGRGGGRDGRAEGEAEHFVSAGAPPHQLALYNWGIYALPARLWIGRRNVKRKMQKEHPEMQEIEIESLVSHELLSSGAAADGGGGGKAATVLPALHAPHHHPGTSSPILIVRVEFSFHSDAMMMRFHRLEGAPLDLVNASHFLEGNGLLPKYTHSLVPMLMERKREEQEEREREKRDAQTPADNAENKRPLSGGKRKHEEMAEEEPMEM